MDLIERTLSLFLCTRWVEVVPLPATGLQELRQRYVTGRKEILWNLLYHSTELSPISTNINHYTMQRRCSSNTHKIGTFSLSRRLISKCSSTAEAALRPGSKTLFVIPRELIDHVTMATKRAASLLNVFRDVERAVTSKRIDEVTPRDTDDAVGITMCSFEIARCRGNSHLFLNDIISFIDNLKVTGNRSILRNHRSSSAKAALVPWSFATNRQVSSITERFTSEFNVWFFVPETVVALRINKISRLAYHPLNGTTTSWRVRRIIRGHCCLNTHRDTHGKTFGHLRLGRLAIHTQAYAVRDVAMEDTTHDIGRAH